MIEEAARPKPLHDPRKPSAQEVAEHEITHIPHRSWCSFCVRARGRGRRHRTVGEEGGVPRVSLDYLFSGQKDDVKPLTVLSPEPLTPKSPSAPPPSSGICGILSFKV